MIRWRVADSKAKKGTPKRIRLGMFQLPVSSRPYRMTINSPWTFSVPWAN